MISGSGVLSNIILSCPLIENLSLSHMRGIFDRHDVLGDGLNNLRRLRSLVLMDVFFDPSVLGDLSSKFPLLKDLTLCKCYIKKGQEDELLISSPSLERLDLTIDRQKWGRWKVMTFDVPNIRKFTYQGTTIPFFSFRSNSRRWESRVTITYAVYLSVALAWLSSLRNFLSKLWPPRIYITLRLASRMSFDYKAGEIQGLPPRKVENLKINLEGMPSLTWYAVWDGLFQMCRPRFITQSGNTDFLRQTLLQGLAEKVSTPIQLMYGLNDLKKARGQIFDEAVSLWRDVPLESLLDHDSTTHPKVRFKLQWQPHVAAA